MVKERGNPQAGGLIVLADIFSLRSGSTLSHLHTMSYSLFNPVPREWPRRLLHIPSMTSRERRLGNLYGEDREPIYSILSYTWGRYEIPEGPHIEIKGIDWKIPSIKEDHFTVEDLSSLLKQICSKHEYVWIDIACIDQRREEVKMEEIGRQATIFKTARQAYVWLNKYEPKTIQHHIQTLLSCSHELVEAKGDASVKIAEIVDSLSRILQDPWFSSLWTLQESILQRHAILLNRSGHPITTSGPWTGTNPNTQLLDLSGACVMARQILGQAMLAARAEGGDQVPPQIGILQRLHRTIDESGIDFGFGPNPNIQYSAARFRQTTRPEDRIYAIMQIYGFKLGNSALPKSKMKNFSLAELELQFLKALNGTSVVLGQAFQHLKVPEPGQTWCITNSIRVPERFHRMILREQFQSAACTITIRQKNEAYFDGMASTLRELLDLWQSRCQEKISAMEKATEAPIDLEERSAFFPNRWDLMRWKQGMIVDYNEKYDFAAMSFEWPPDTAVIDDIGDPIVECRIPEMTQAADKQQALGKALIDRYGDEEIRVFYLGRSQYIESMDLALVLVRGQTEHKHSTKGKPCVWRRVAICFWHVRVGVASEGLAKAMKPLKGMFG